MAYDTSRNITHLIFGPISEKDGKKGPEYKETYQIHLTAF